MDTIGSRIGLSNNHEFSSFLTIGSNNTFLLQPPLSRQRPNTTARNPPIPQQQTRRPARPGPNTAPTDKRLPGGAQTWRPQRYQAKTDIKSSLCRSMLPLRNGWKSQPEGTPENNLYGIGDTQRQSLIIADLLFTPRQCSCAVKRHKNLIDNRPAVPQKQKRETSRKSSAKQKTLILSHFCKV